MVAPPASEHRFLQMMHSNQTTHMASPSASIFENCTPGSLIGSLKPFVPQMIGHGSPTATYTDQKLQMLDEA